MRKYQEEIMERRVIEGIGPEFLARQGLVPRPEVWEDGLRTGGRRDLIEWWYFDATLENGITLVIVFYTNKFSLQRNAPITPAVEVAIKRPGFPPRDWTVPFPAEAFNAARDRCDVRIADNWVRGDLHTYTLHVDLEEVAVDLELTSQVDPWRPGAGMNFHDKALEPFFAWVVPVPLGEVKGRLRLNGQEHSFQGTGYHDHNWGIADLSQVYSHWYWGRFHLPPYTGIFVEITATPAYGRQRMYYLMLTRAGRVIFETGTGHVQLEATDFQSHPSGPRYPTRLAWHAEEAERRLHIVLRDPEVIENQSLLEGLPVWTRLLARLIGKNPYYFSFRSRMTLELYLPEIQETLSGTARYEIMRLD